MAQKKIINNRYKLEESVIGKGAFSKVYLGVDVETDLKVAVKKINLSEIPDKIKTRVLGEITIVQSLEHPNVIRTYDISFSSDNSHAYIIMEYCSGGDFGKFIRPGEKMKEQKIQYYFRQLAKGLQYLRLKHIVHRDIKPANLLLSCDDQILKIADFGFARTLDQSHLTATYCGSPLYMAPEILLGEKYNDKADLWSVGIILYQCIYGKPPYESINNISDLIQIFRNSDRINVPKNVIVSEECYDLLFNLLQMKSNIRLSWDKFFEHAWLIDVSKSSPMAIPSNEFVKIPPYSDNTPETIVRVYQQGQNISVSDIGTPSIAVNSAPMRTNISFSPNIIRDYCPSSSPKSESLSTRRNNLSRSSSSLNRSNLTDSDQKTPPDEGYGSGVWSVLSSSFQSMSIFGGK